MTRHVVGIAVDPESVRRGGSTRVAECTCGWRGPQRSTLELASDDALEHERHAPSPRPWYSKQGGLAL